MRMGHRLGAGSAVFAAAIVAATGAFAAPKCATPAEVTAIQTAAVQQELMVAALTCNEVPEFNAFQTSFSTELRSSDRRLMSMFRRLFGGRQGDAEYHAFKTRLANGSSIRSIHDNAAYCRETQMVFAAALTAEKPALADFVSGVAVHDEDSPVDSCEIRVASGLGGLKAGPDVTPKPNPLRLAAMTPVEAPAQAATTTAAPATSPEGAASQMAASPARAAAPIETAAQQPNAPSATPAPTATAQTEEKDKKSSGWLSGLSGIFN